jgi:tagatose-1,6-bisphosphate aldolase non-catalytic subunit AgaZ/GatZ
MAAALREGWTGPVFIQGDHFQINHKKYLADPKAEMATVLDLTSEALAAGFYNIDVDTSTLVDLDKPTHREQQDVNGKLCAAITSYIRQHEPEGVTVSVGGEIGEVGGKNSTAEELEAFVEVFNAELAKLAPGKPGMSKILDRDRHEPRRRADAGRHGRQGEARLRHARGALEAVA